MPFISTRATRAAYDAYILASTMHARGASERRNPNWMRWAKQNLADAEDRYREVRYDECAKQRDALPMAF